MGGGEIFCVSPGCSAVYLEPICFFLLGKYFFIPGYIRRLLRNIAIYTTLVERWVGVGRGYFLFSPEG